MITGRTPILGATAIAAVVAMSLAGCGSSSPAAPKDNTGSHTTSSDTSKVTPSTGSNGDKGDGDRGGDVSDFDPTKPKAPVRVTYKSDDGDTFTLSWDGTNSAYISTDGKFITTKDETIMCSDNGCVKTANTGAAGAGVAGGFMAMLNMLGSLKDSQPNLFTDKSSATIAGRNATCMTFDASKLAALGGDADTTGKAQFCWDNKSGVLLRLQSTDKDETGNLEATEVGQPKDDDFKPTGPVTDMSKVGGGS